MNLYTLEDIGDWVTGNTDYISGITPQQWGILLGLLKQQEYAAFEDFAEDLGFIVVDASGSPVSVNSSNASSIRLEVDTIKGGETPAAQGSRNEAARLARTQRQKEREKKKQMRRDKIAGFTPNIGGGITFGQQTNFLGWIVGGIALVMVILAVRFGTFTTKKRRRR